MQNLSQAGWIRPSKLRALSAGVIGTLRTPARLIPRNNTKQLNWILINLRKLVSQVARNVIEHWVFYYCPVIPVIISDSNFLTRLLVLKIIKFKKKNTIYFQYLIVKVRLNRIDAMIDDIFKCIHVWIPYSNFGRKICMTLTKASAKTRF